MLESLADCRITLMILGLSMNPSVFANQKLQPSIKGLFSKQKKMIKKA